MVTISTLPGTRDILPEEIGYWQYVEATAAKILGRAMYREIRSPIFENTSLFERGIGEATDVLIGALYKSFHSIQEVNLWLDDIWEKDSEIFLKAPYKFKSKTVLQEWCQSKGFDLPVYKIIEVSKKNGDPKRFSCDIFIEGLKESSAFGKSHKQAETNAARVLIEKFITIGKI